MERVPDGGDRQANGAAGAPVFGQSAVPARIFPEILRAVPPRGRLVGRERGVCARAELSRGGPFTRLDAARDVSRAPSLWRIQRACARFPRRASIWNASGSGIL